MGGIIGTWVAIRSLGPEGIHVGVWQPHNGSWHNHHAFTVQPDRTMLEQHVQHDVQGNSGLGVLLTLHLVIPILQPHNDATLCLRIIIGRKPDRCLAMPHKTETDARIIDFNGYNDRVKQMWRKRAPGHAIKRISAKTKFIRASLIRSYV